MRVPTVGRRLYSMLMFFLVSVLGGVLVAGLFVPTAGIITETTKSVALAMNDIPEELEVGPPSEGSKVLMANGEVLATFFDQNRKNVPLDQIAPIMRQAQVGIEDQRFYQHGALDLRGTLRALVRSSSGSTQGGSTLTQQYVKLALLYDAQARNDTAGMEAANNRTVNRKILEMRYAIAVEKKLSKDEILERYLNISYFGDRAYGIEAAAQHYFGIPAKDLSLPQAAMMAGIVRNPVTTNPVANEAAATERMRNVLDRLVAIKIITKQQADEAKQYKFDKSKVTKTPNRGCSTSQYPHLCDYVYQTLKTLPSLGPDAQSRVNTLNNAALTIQTEIDPRFQDAAQNSVSNFVAPTDGVNALMNMVQPGTGLIKAMAQSKYEIGTKPGQTFYNFSAPRALGGGDGFEGGSTFKAFAVTAAALINAKDPNQFDPNKLRIDSPETVRLKGLDWKGCKLSRTEVDWSPKTDKTLVGMYNTYDGATASSNTFFAQLEQRVGVCNTVKAAELLGLQRADRANLQTGILPNGKLISAVNPNNVVDGDNPNFVLGNSMVTPVSLVSAYATLAARGKRCDPIILKGITDQKNRQYEVPSANCKQVIPEAVADQVNDILHGPFSFAGTAEKAMIDGHMLSGKTGTMAGNKAILLNGYSPDLAGLAIVAVDPKHPDAIKARDAATNEKGTFTVTGVPVHGKNYPKGYALRGSSGREAGGQIWKPTMQAALPLLENRTKFVKPPNSPYAEAETNSDIAYLQKIGKITLGDKKLDYKPGDENKSDKYYPGLIPQGAAQTDLQAGIAPAGTQPTPGASAQPGQPASPSPAAQPGQPASPSQAAQPQPSTPAPAGGSPSAKSTPRASATKTP